MLVCSAESLVRAGVRNEIQETLDREAEEGGSSILIPVVLDDEAFGHWSPDRPQLSRSVKKRVVADFRQAWRSDEDFAAAMKKLSAAILKKA